MSERLWNFYFDTAPFCFLGLDRRTGHARIFFPDRQELAIAQTACRSSKNTLARPPCRGKLAETMI
ncbi:MAG: hypothetical protein V2B19_11840, partial [Pseudomonadota bacterium]